MVRLSLKILTVFGAFASSLSAVVKRKANTLTDCWNAMPSSSCSSASDSR